MADAVADLDAITGQDEDDPFTNGPGSETKRCYMDYLSSSEVLRGARFGLPIRRCWDTVPSSCRTVASKVLDAIRRAGAEIIEVDFPSIEERTNENGTWDWELGEATKSEWTVAKVDAYNGINSYLAKLKDCRVTSVEEIVEFNKQNAGSEGAEPGVVPAFPDGQPNLLEIVQAKGVKDDTYHTALAHIHVQTRDNGIDAALKYTEPRTGTISQLDALLFCDRRGIGQQYAAQAGYSIICIPIGLDIHGMPVSLSFQHTAFREAELIKWASALEHLWNEENGWRATPSFRSLLANNVPIEMFCE